MKTSKKLKSMLLATVAISMMSVSCKKKEQSSATGWNYNDPQNGGYLKTKYVEQETGPGLVLVEGGTFTMGREELNKKLLLTGTIHQEELLFVHFI